MKDLNHRMIGFVSIRGPFVYSLCTSTILASAGGAFNGHVEGTNPIIR
jgi:hypothetical protein